MTKRDRHAAVYHARSTKRGLALYTVTVDVNLNDSMTARLDVTPKPTEQNRIVHAGKSEAEVTSNKKLRLRCGTIVANY